VTTILGFSTDRASQADLLFYRPSASLLRAFLGEVGRFFASREKALESGKKAMAEIVVGRGEVIGEGVDTI
jgi:hypothetical protein